MFKLHYISKEEYLSLQSSYFLINITDIKYSLNFTPLKLRFICFRLDFSCQVSHRLLWLWYALTHYNNPMIYRHNSCRKIKCLTTDDENQDHCEQTKEKRHFRCCSTTSARRLVQLSDRSHVALAKKRHPISNSTYRLLYTFLEFMFILESRAYK